MDANKSLGQHWLEDPTSLKAIVQAAQLVSGEEVLEIGPGHGALTLELLSRGVKVLAIEKDRTLAQKLRDQELPNLTVMDGDILKFDFAKLPTNYKIVANIPYYLTSHLFRILTEIGNMPTRAVLLVQKEVAERVAAAPGSMSLLSVAVQLYYLPKLGAAVSRDKFSPPPKVDSQVLVLVKRPGLLFEDLDEDNYFKFVKAGFSERRKKLRGSLAGGLGVSKDQADSLLAAAKIDSNLRAQNLSLEQWYNLSQIPLSAQKT